MTKAKRLSKKQLAVIDDMFAGELGEQAVLDKHKVSRYLYNRWLADKVFAEQFDQRITGAYRQSTFLIARSAPLAAGRLVRLTESGKGETTRKVCLDIISMHAPADRPAATAEVVPDLPNLSSVTVGRLLTVLAEENDRK